MLLIPKNMKKIISFCLYGDDQKYCHGMICNIELAKIIYPDWIVRVYYGNSVPTEIVDMMKNYSHIELVNMPENMQYQYMMWRFLPISDDDVEVMLSRDADSRLSYREKVSVDIFLESEFLLHSIRDQRNHDDIMGGMWGMKKNNRINMRKLVESWDGHLGYNSDQEFLRKKIKPHFHDSCLTHCSFYLKNYPIEPENHFFVGQVFPDGKNGGLGYDYIYY